MLAAKAKKALQNDTISIVTIGTLNRMKHNQMNVCQRRRHHHRFSIQTDCGNKKDE